MALRELLLLSQMLTAFAFHIGETRSVLVEAEGMKDSSSIALSYEGMEESLRSIAKDVEKYGINTTTSGAVNGFIITIKTDLLKCIETDRNLSQSLFDKARDAVDQCNTDRSTWFLLNDKSKPGYKQFDDKVTSAQDTMDGCRIAENTTLANVTDHCKTLEDRICKPWATCVAPDFSTLDGDNDEVFAYMCCIHEFFEEHRGHYYNEKKACETATSLHKAKVAACDTAQETFEREYCTRESKIQDQCEEYDECRCTNEAAFAKQKSDIVSLEEIWQAQFVALKHLLCYGEAILQNKTDLSDCNLDDDCDKYTDCPKIVYSDFQDWIVCSEPAANFPCGEAFLSEFYSDVIGTCTPPDDCTPCKDADVINGAWSGERKTVVGEDGMCRAIQDGEIDDTPYQTGKPKPVDPEGKKKSEICNREDGKPKAGAWAQFIDMKGYKKSSNTITQVNGSICWDNAVPYTSGFNMKTPTRMTVSSKDFWQTVPDPKDWPSVRDRVSGKPRAMTAEDFAGHWGDNYRTFHICLPCNSQAEFTVQMWQGINFDQAVNLPDMAMTIVDVDGASSGLEEITVCGADRCLAHTKPNGEKDSLVIESNDPNIGVGCKKYTNTANTKVSAPNENALSRAQAQVAVEFLFSEKRSINFVVKAAEKDCNADRGRKFYVSFEPRVSCAEYAVDLGED